MKVMSLEDLIKAEAAFAMAYDIGNKHDEKSAILWRLIHTAREYHRLRQACSAAINELGVPQPGYPAPVANASDILRKALEEGE